LPKVIVADAAQDLVTAEGATQIVLNPPYGKVRAPEGCSWATGKVSQAAIFAERCVSAAAPGTRLVAILPDVRRSGSFYARWRKRIEERTTIDSVQIVGAFEGADVDVFILRLIVGDVPIRSAAAKWYSPDGNGGGSVGDQFDVHVGAVVLHRHREIGPSRPFVMARDMPAWSTVDMVHGKRRRFNGRTFQPPFIVVRRTSAPREKRRAVGTLVLGTQPVAVENHLLVLLPKDGQAARCRQVLKVLGNRQTDRRLNGRIRCRHLTVSALRELPWWAEAHDD
jgi:hypothetical protein